MVMWEEREGMRGGGNVRRKGQGGTDGWRGRGRERNREGRMDGEGEGVINNRGEKGTGRDGDGTRNEPGGTSNMNHCCSNE